MKFVPFTSPFVASVLVAITLAEVGFILFNVGTVTSIFVVLIGSAFFLGAAISTQPFFDYVSNPQTLRYVWGGAPNANQL